MIKERQILSPTTPTPHFFPALICINYTKLGVIQINSIYIMHFTILFYTLC